MYFKEDVTGLISFGEAPDQLGFLEALTEHISNGKYEESSKKEERKLIQMINLTAPRLIQLQRN